MPALVMLGLIGAGALGGSYVLDVWEVRWPGSSTPTWVMAGVSLLSTLAGPVWLGLLGAGVFVGAVLPGLVETWQSRQAATQRVDTSQPPRIVVDTSQP